MKQMTAVYDLYEQVVEELLGQLSAIVVTIQSTQSVIRMRIQAGCKGTSPAISGLSLPGGRVTCEAQDEDLIVEATIGQGGAAK